MRTVIFAAVLLSLVCIATGRGIWGSRKKKEDEEISVTVPKQQRHTPGRNTRNSFGNNNNNNNNVADNIRNMLNAYTTMMETLVDSPEFDSMITPESVKNIIMQVPGYDDNVELRELINSPQFSNPELLKATIVEGINTLKTYTDTIIEFVNDPAKMQEIIDQVPENMKEILEAVMSGDTSSIKEYIKSFPGIQEDQRELLTSLLDGNTESTLKSVQDILSSPEQIEAARQQFLSDPQMAEMLGIPDDVLHSKEKWAALMADGLEALAQQEASGFPVDDYDLDMDLNGNLNNRFGQARV